MSGSNRRKKISTLVGLLRFQVTTRLDAVVTPMREGWIARYELRQAEHVRWETARR